ncbi:uncharacterized protein VTP21DRAFT_9439 [Calcarisporiella thermophila]|uniref:uncharacterized protein n=1 Tax=Calcarisporiella thermophila TaxID=911321 RepID=UPI0037424F28
MLAAEQSSDTATPSTMPSKIQRQHRIRHAERDRFHRIGSLVKNLLRNRGGKRDSFKQLFMQSLYELVKKKQIIEPVPTIDDTIDLSHLHGDDLRDKVVHFIHRLDIPGWHDIVEQDVQLSRISGALTNCVFLVTAPSKRQKLLLRVYGVGVEQLFHREKELYWMRLLSQLNIGAQLLGIFGNGRFEQYLESTTLTRFDLRDPQTSRSIARKLYELHSIVNTFPPKNGSETVPEVWVNIDKWYELALSMVTEWYKKNPDEKRRDMLRQFDLFSLRDEIDQLKCEIPKAAPSPIVFAHNDTQYGNILRLDSPPHELVIVDFEYAGYNFRGYDIGNHFCEWMADYHSEEPHILHLERYPNHEEQLNFLEAYLDAELVASSRKLDAAARQDALEKLADEANKWAVVSHLLWGLWGLVQAAQSEIDFDYFSYALQRLEIFRTMSRKYGWTH